jgi:hypothetical protein
MNKIILLFLFFVSVSYSQEKLKAYIEKTETVSFDQYDFIKKSNEYYPDILVSKQVRNNFVTDLKEQRYLDSEFVYNLPSDCSAYRVKVFSNFLLDYAYMLKDGTYVAGNIRVFNGDYIRTLFKSKGDFRLVQYFINGKLINENKN